MGKTTKWLKSLLIRRKKKDKVRDSMTASPATKEKMRWSFRRSVGSAKELRSPEPSISAPCHGLSESEIDQKRHAMAVAVATAVAADAAVAAAHAAAAVVRLTVITSSRTTRAVMEDAAVKIQSVFRSYLARKALAALKGLVKLQALVRGNLVRKQATATLRCMEALVNAQVRARAKRIGIGMAEESQATPQRRQNFRRSPQHRQFRQSFESTRDGKVDVKVVEMDLGETRSSCSIAQTERADQMYSPYNGAIYTPIKTDLQSQFSPTPSTLTNTNMTSPRAYNSPYFSAMSMPAQSYIDYPLHPNYMSNTESSRAKARSQSAPKQRLDAYERQSSKKRPSMEGRNVPRGTRMQRSSSHVGLMDNNYEYPWLIKFDKSNTSVNESECGSTSTILTNAYCRSLLGYEILGYDY